MAETDELVRTDDAARAVSEAEALREEVLEALEAGDAARLAGLVRELHPADLADLIEQIEPEHRVRLLELAGEELGDVLSELDEGLREDLLERLPAGTLARALRELETDDVVDIVEDLEPEQAEEVIAGLAEPERAAVRSSLAFPEDSAGRLMQRELVVAPETWTVGQAIDMLRAAEELPEQFYHVILVDPRMHPVGQVALGRLLASRREVPLREIAEEDFWIFKATDSQEDVAYAFNKYHIISAPVVDEGGRVIGVLTIDDVMSVLEEETEEDMLRLAGVGDESLTDTVTETARQRQIWLFVNLVTAIVASVVIDAFSDAIDAYVALAVLMPIVASMGGNAGTQSMTVAVRALATRDLTGANSLRVIRRELAVGAVNGLVFAVVMGAIAWLWFGDPMLGAVIGIAMILTLIAAALGGIVIPMALERLGVDPALASGPFVTTVTDVVSFLTFLGLASWILL
ncbi:MAG: magnesium transporter [Alphaproteobacteria bacterium]|nr:MAG: magnesium transporter [Alphaproteobacteria bacterium]